MNSKKEKKFKAQRPQSSVRDYDDFSGLETSDKKTKIPKLPKRTYSLEGKENTFNGKKSGNRHQSSTTSMIPRPERQKFSRHVHSLTNSPKEQRANKKKEKKHPKSANVRTEMTDEKCSITRESPSQTVVNLNTVECKLEKDFMRFKENILKIPEYWSDADQTVKNILKNAVGIVSKQYPHTDVEAFETEIQNILKATEVVKKEILAKTEDIVSQANKIYGDGYETDGPSEEEVKLITEKLNALTNNVSPKHSAFEDLLQHGCELNEIVGMDKIINLEGKLNLVTENSKYKKEQLCQDKRVDSRKNQKRLDSKTKVRVEGIHETMTQSCGDILRQDAKTVIRMLNSSASGTPPRYSNSEDKSCQTMSLWATEFLKREESLRRLNNQILELHRLCKDHITKFKSFNFQIKLRGICNKAQTILFSRDIQPGGKKLSFYNKNADHPVKQRDIDLYQKNRLIKQQKKLLHARDELIEMLKTRRNVKVEEI